jgi:hypothetical protein
MAASKPSSNPVLQMDLHFRHNADLSVWARLLEAIFGWDPRLRPTHVERLSDPDASGKPEPWTEERAAELARRCAGERRPAWRLFSDRQEGAALAVSREKFGVEISLIIPPPARELPSHLEESLRISRQAGAPAGLVLLLDRGWKGRPDYLVFGTWKVEAVPPLLYLDRQAVGRAGGRARVLAAPCPVVEMEHGGLLLAVRVPPWGPPSQAHRDRTAAVERHLGVGPDHLLDLAGP